MTTENLIFRFKFSSDFTDHLTPFAKLHQYDDRHTYKEAWTQWLVINDELVDMEVERMFPTLKNSGEFWVILRSKPALN